MTINYDAIIAHPDGTWWPEEMGHSVEGTATFIKENYSFTFDSITQSKLNHIKYLSRQKCTKCDKKEASSGCRSCIARRFMKKLQKDIESFYKDVET